ncbi:MAG: tetratricopeptide repeat protein [Erythrobacter sp.]
MTWLAVAGLAIVTLILAAVVLRLPKSGWTLFAAALMFGLTGYAWQGSAELASNPKTAQVSVQQSGEEMVEIRLGLFDAGVPKPGYLTLSDGFARRGKFADAAGLLRQGLVDNPDHVEGWIALGNALVEHTDGVVTPPARIAYERAHAVDRSNPAALFVLGASYLRMRDIREARAVWAQLLADAPADAEWREELELRIQVLDQAINGGPVTPRPPADQNGQ